MNLLKTFTVIGKTAKKCAPTILSVAGAAGVAVTGVAAAKAGYEDAKEDARLGYGIKVGDREYDKFSNIPPAFWETPEERRKRKIKTYAKPIIFGAASMGCILAGDRLHAKRYMALGAAAGIIQERYDRLRGYLTTCKGYREEDGERKDYEAPGQLEKTTRFSADSMAAADIFEYCKEHGIEPEDTHTGDQLWYEPLSKTYFLASEGHVERAFSLANKALKTTGEATLMDLLKYLELRGAEQPGYDLYHWNEYEGDAFYGYDWIEPRFIHKKLHDGPEFIQIFYPVEPHLGEK